MMAEEARAVVASAMKSGLITAAQPVRRKVRPRPIPASLRGFIPQEPAERDAPNEKITISLPPSFLRVVNKTAFALDVSRSAMLAYAFAYFHEHAEEAGVLMLPLR